MCVFCGCYNHPGQLKDDRAFGNIVLDDQSSSIRVAYNYIKQANNHVSLEVI